MVVRLLAGLWCCVLMAAVSPRALGQDVMTGTGSAIQVIDGDTIEIGGRVVDLYGIDAPELGQVCIHNGTPWQCGLEAAFILRKMLSVEHAKVACRPWPKTKGGSTAICEAGPLDLAHALISGGYATVPAGSFPDYLERQRVAKRAEVGLWRGKFVPPADWRAGKRLPGEESLRSDLAACPVKGMIDTSGRKVYRVPTDSGFRAAHVAPDRGERCFASDEAARAEGWRRLEQYPAAPPTPR